MSQCDTGTAANLAALETKLAKLEAENRRLKCLDFPGGWEGRDGDLISLLERVAADCGSPLHEMAALRLRNLQKRLQEVGGTREAVKSGIACGDDSRACSGRCGG